MTHRLNLNRRTVIKGMMLASAATLVPPWIRAETRPMMRTIPSSGERIPSVGLGTWITFNVGQDPVLLDERAAVMQAFFEDGGAMIDSSPMYGSSQATVGYGLDKLGYPESLFSADKVWTGNPNRRQSQIAESLDDWRQEHFDLLQVHNLVAWRDHLPRLQKMKANGEIRYVGITTSDGRRHDQFESIMRSERIDFAQLSYNILNREAEKRLLPLARDEGIAVIANRPFQQDRLTQWLADKPLPPWADELKATSWAQILLKFILGHPAITCVIPATTRVDHVRENLAAAREPLPDAAMRERMAAFVRDLA
ncbi:aldo/keto reductase [Saccharospirillum salsuginis]|uniref:Oxidoreductase n=1 Tax=Saccharospirillum salsuginis TaxID=418750 RepID=A0A918NCW5_9GAMM|nr:aldo/keto reductase [Saccharospirillum salsuginis]GGX60953.1 oxidoreductase [Saccharospirillum salsuginis]